MSKLSYLGWVIGRRLAGQNRDCPFCGASNTRLLGRKKLVVELRACAACRLKFRWPKPEKAALKKYYQEAYFREETTETPDDSELARLTETNFAGAGNNDISHRVAVLKSFREAGRVLDYGCSWGYGPWQLSRAGYDVTGFEISHARADFARNKLGQTVIDDPETLAAMPAGSFDIVFTSHVLEHLPDPKDPFALFRRLLKPGGLLLAFVPNADGEAARSLGFDWGPLIDQDHVLALDAPFFAAHLPDFGFPAPAFNTDPYAAPFRSFDDPDAAAGALPGEELCVAAEAGGSA